MSKVHPVVNQSTGEVLVFESKEAVDLFLLHLAKEGKWKRARPTYLRYVEDCGENGFYLGLA